MAQFYSRKPNRLPLYNYNQQGLYFITICTKDKQCILGTVTPPKTDAELPQMHLSDLGTRVEEEIQRQAACYNHISIEKFIVMPNHIHLLLFLRNSDDTITNRANEAIPKYISTLKRFTNKAVGFDLWQRSYHDHIIRTEQEYLRIWQYIDSNAAKWQSDCYYSASY